MKIIRVATIGILVFIVTLITPFTATAATCSLPGANNTCLDQFYSGNNIEFYDPNSSISSCGGSGSIVVETSGQGLANLKSAYAYFIAKGLTNIQSAGIVGNMQVESGGYTNRLEGSPPGKGPSDPTGVSSGWGIVQWTPGSGFLTYKQEAGAQGADTDLQVQLDTLWWEVSKGPEQAAIAALKGTSDVTSSTTIWAQKFERPSASALAQSLPDRINFATTALNTFPTTINGQAPTSTSSETSSGCGGGAVQGSIIQTAEGFAITHPLQNITSGWQQQAKPSFVSAVQQYDSSLLPGTPPGEPYADCGMFVSIVMRASKVDPNYPPAGTIDQLAYIKSHPSQYKIIDSPTMSQLQPGMILIVNNGVDHHTMIYTGNIGTYQGQQLIAIDASQAERAPSYRPTASVQWILSRPGVIAAQPLTSQGASNQ